MCVTQPPEDQAKPSNVNGMLEGEKVTRGMQRQEMPPETERQGKTPPPCLWRDQVLTKPSDSLLPEDAQLAAPCCVSHGAQWPILGGRSLVSCLTEPLVAAEGAPQTTTEGPQPLHSGAESHMALAGGPSI